MKTQSKPEASTPIVLSVEIVEMVICFLVASSFGKHLLEGFLWTLVLIGATLYLLGTHLSFDKKTIAGSIAIIATSFFFSVFFR